MVSTESEILTENSNVENNTSSDAKGFYDAVFKKWDYTNNSSNIAIIEKGGETYLEGGMVSCIGVDGSSVDTKYIVTNTILFKADDEGMWLCNQNTGQILTEKIPIYEIANNLYIKQSDFESIIKPQIDIVLDENGIKK